MKERLEKEDAEDGDDGPTELKDWLGLTSLFVSVFVTSSPRRLTIYIFNLISFFKENDKC
jgi:hypothetical protein